MNKWTKKATKKISQWPNFCRKKYVDMNFWASLSSSSLWASSGAFRLVTLGRRAPREEMCAKKAKKAAALGAHFCPLSQLAGGEPRSLCAHGARQRALLGGMCRCGSAMRSCVAVRADRRWPPRRPRGSGHSLQPTVPPSRLKHKHAAHRLKQPNCKLIFSFNASFGVYN